LDINKKYGADYGETFAPVAMNGTNRFLLCVAAQWRRRQRKVDVMNAFQTTDLMGARIYIDIPDRFEFLHPEFDKEKI